MMNIEIHYNIKDKFSDYQITSPLGRKQLQPMIVYENMIESIKYLVFRDNLDIKIVCTISLFISLYYHKLLAIL